MLSVILTILKIIGIVLLCILGVVLLLVLLVLLCPIRYEIRAEVREGEEELTKRAEANIRVNYLLHLLRGRFVYPAAEQGMLSVYIAFFRIFPRGKKKEETAEVQDGDTDEFPDEPEEEKADTGESAAEPGSAQQEDAAPLEPSEQTEEQAEEDQDAAPGEPEGSGEAEEPVEPEGSGETENAEKETDGSNDKTSFRERISGILNKISALSGKPQVAAEKIYYTTCGIYDKINKVRVTLDSEIFARAKQLLFNEARRVVRHILPRKCRVSMVYGTDDPAKTADMAAKVSMLYPIFEERVRVIPCFEKETMYGSALIRGRVRLIVPLYSFLRLYFSRDVKKTVRRFKSIKEGGVTGGGKKDK